VGGNNVVSIATCYGMEYPGMEFRWEHPSNVP